MPLDLSIDASSPVMISGATGYVAGHIVKRLLEAGVTVHAPVRDPSREDKLRHLNAIAAASPGAIRYYRADLLVEGSYGEAMDGCSIVFHTASPCSLIVKDPQKELVDPALLGTRNVLREANRRDTVKRVVLTSSCAAIYGDNTEVAQAPGGVLTEDNWNTTSTLQHQPYSYSKTVAEQAAWEIAKAQSHWELVVINPSVILGPGISPFATSESFTIARQFGDGTMKRGAPRFGIGVVDVREVADAHLAAAYLPHAHGRYIVSGYNTDLFAIAQTLAPAYGDDYPIARVAMPKWLVWLVAPFFSKSLTRKMIARNVDIPWIADNSKSIRELGVAYRPLAETTNEMFQQLIDSGQLKK